MSVSTLLGRLSWVFASFAILTTVFAQLDRLALGPIGWLFDLFAHFPKHWAVASILALGIAAAMRRWGLALASLAALAANLTSLALVPPFATPQPAPADARLVRIVSANVHGSPEALANLARLARDYRADLVSVYEAPGLTGGDLHALFPDASRIQLVDHGLDRRPLSTRLLVVALSDIGPITIKHMTGARRAALSYSLAGAQIVAAHAALPDRPASLRDRNALLASLAREVDPDHPFVVMGDFNATPFSSIFRTLPGTRAGDPRLETTFPAKAPWLGIPIDTFQFGGGLVLTEHHVGPDIGSDHLPVFAAFALPSAPALPRPAPRIDASPPPVHVSPMLKARNAKG